MQLTLFRALQSINVADDTAAAVVESVENHMATRVEQATKPLEAKVDAKFDALQTSMVGLQAAMTRQTTLLAVILSVVGLLVASAVALGPLLATLIRN